MAYRIALTFEDGVTRFIHARPDELVADAAYRDGVNIPMDCRDGACGTCKCFCEQGRYTLNSYLDEALTEQEAREGYVLTCQMRVQSPCVLRIPASSSACKVKAAALPATLAGVEPLSPTTIAFDVQLAAQEEFCALAGQYVHVSVPGTDQTRSYSFSAMPQAGRLRFLVRNIPGGLMSGYLAERARPGDAMTLTGPMGQFYLRELRRPVLFLAGGTGLAPFLAMLDAMQGAEVSQPVHLMYGVTQDSDLVEVESLHAYAALLPRFSFTTLVADPASIHPRKGYVTQHLPSDALHGGDVDVYVCGPPAMVDAVRGFLTEQGVKPANFYAEKFSPTG